MSINYFEDVEIFIDYTLDDVDESWFDENGEVIEGSGLNRQFFPIDRLSVEYARKICSVENSQLVQIAAGEISFIDIMETEESVEDDEWWTRSLDLGVRGAVMAIRAMGGYPVSSCNAGCFVDDPYVHSEKHHPVIGFQGSSDCIRLVEDVARKNGCGLYGPIVGCLVLSTSDIRNFGKFALDLLSHGDGVESTN
jgi:hypothetical protein